MKINNEFTVSVPVETAWNTMLDLEEVAPCLPGAAIQESTGDREYKGTMKVKIGPITASYKGNVKIEEADETNHRAVIDATGRDARGQGTASATIVTTMQGEGDQTKVQVETDMHLTGRAAQFGRGIAQDVASKMLGQFADCLEEKLAGEGSAGAGTAEASESSGSASGDTSGSTSGAASGARSQETPSATPVGGAGTLGNVVSAEAGTTAAGGTVAGAVVSGATPSDAAAGATSTSTEQPRTQETPRGEPREPEAFDMGAAGSEAVMKRLGPVLAGVGVLVVLILLFRRKR